MPPLYSHSRLSSFENCPKQFQFRYVLKIPSLSEGIEAFVGKRVHEVLERLHEFVDRGQVPSLQKVVARFQALWEQHFDGDRIRIAREGTPVEYYQNLGERCLENYYRRRYPFDAEETLGLEQRVVFPVDDEGRVKLQGIVDRVARTPDGTIEIHDYKTGARVPSQKVLDSDRQLALYQIGLAREHGEGERFRLVWHYVAKGQVRTSTRTPEQLAELRRDVIELVARIEAEAQYEPRESALCGWCEYRSICPAFAPAEVAEEAVAAARAVSKGGGGESAAPRRQLSLL